jgi:fructoselysine 6-kinase
MVSILTARDNVVDCYVDEGLIFAGGNALNVAVFARSAGAKTAYAGTIGTDAAGALIQSALARADVSTEFLQVRPGSTAYCVIGRDNGDRVFREAGPGVSGADLPSDFLRRASAFDAVHLSESSALADMVPDLSAVSLVSFDFSTNRDARLLRSVTPHCFLASFSGAGLTGDAGLALARWAVTLGANWSLVTRGRSGAVLVGTERSYDVPAAETTLVDTLGAGDTFIATLLVGLLEGKNPPEAMARASEAAAVTCSRLGAFGEEQYLAAIPLPAG